MNKNSETLFLLQISEKENELRIQKLMSEKNDLERVKVWESHYPYGEATRVMESRTLTQT